MTCWNSCELFGHPSIYACKNGSNPIDDVRGNLKWDFSHRKSIEGRIKTEEAAIWFFAGSASRENGPLCRNKAGRLYLRPNFAGYNGTMKIEGCPDGVLLS